MTQEFVVGNQDPYIKKIQRMLNQECSLNLTCDGGFGPMTHNAVITYQTKKLIRQTGTYSPQMALIMDPLIAAKYLVEASFIQAAALLGVPVATVKAVQQVETSGAGFFNDGRAQILFERHVFRRQLMAFMARGSVNVGSVARAAGLTFNPTTTTAAVVDQYLQTNWGDVYNATPGGYSVGSLEYSRLAKAATLDPASAQSSASWGLFQLMGYQYVPTKYPSVAAFVADAQVSESLQLQQFIKYVLSDLRLTNSLRARDWHTFAIAYNGPAQQGYDTKMAQAATYWDLHPVTA